MHKVVSADTNIRIVRSGLCIQYRLTLSIYMGGDGVHNYYIVLFYLNNFLLSLHSGSVVLSNHHVPRGWVVVPIMYNSLISL